MRGNDGDEISLKVRVRFHRTVECGNPFLMKNDTSQGCSLLRGVTALFGSFKCFPPVPLNRS